jgi:hypothetical protein
MALFGDLDGVRLSLPNQSLNTPKLHTQMQDSPSSSMFINNEIPLCTRIDSPTITRCSYPTSKLLLYRLKM